MDKTIPAPQTANLTCAGRGYGDIMVEWFRGRRDNPVADKAFITNASIPGGITSTLTIPNVDGSDGARYRCRLTNSAGFTDSARARLTIGGKHGMFIQCCINPHIYTDDPPRITTHPMDVLADNGSNVTFTCVAVSYLGANFTWMYNGEVLKENDRTIITTTNSTITYTTTLMILNVQLPDIGSYMCRGTNREGPRESNPGILQVVGKWISITCITVLELQN